MRLLTVKQIKELSKGEIIPSCKLEIVSVRKSSAGQSQHGPWTVQNIKGKDSTGEIGLQLWNQSDDLRETDIGRIIYLESVDGKHGLQGVKRDESEYKGTKYPQISVSKSANVIMDGDIQEGYESAPEAPRNGPDAKPAPEARPDALAAYKRALESKLHGLSLCFDAAKQLVDDPESIRSVAIHLAIGLERQFAADNLPPMPRQEPLPKAPMPAIQRTRPQAAPGPAPRTQQNEDDIDSSVPF